MSYMINGEDVIWDAMTPEDVIIADLGKGRYSTLSGVGSKFLWERVINKVSKADIIVSCQNQFKNFNNRDIESIEHIMSQLEYEGIIKKSDASIPIEKLTFSSPGVKFESMNIRLVQYDYMQTLLKLYPIDNIIEA